jgi:hypothetical protein
MGRIIKINKKVKDKWKNIDAIQEKHPHHTVFCPSTGYLYTRKGKLSKTCPDTGKRIKNGLVVGEFWVKKDKIIIKKKSGSSLEKLRKGEKMTNQGWEKESQRHRDAYYKGVQSKGEHYQCRADGCHISFWVKPNEKRICPNCRVPTELLRLNDDDDTQYGYRLRR